MSARERAAEGEAPPAAAVAVAVGSTPLLATEGLQPELQPGETELVQAFASHALVQEALQRRYEQLKGIRGGAKGPRHPNTLRAIERRWFVGKQTIQKAARVALDLAESPRALTPERVAESDLLVGTATMLALAQDGRKLVTLKPETVTSPLAQGKAAGPYRELQMCVLTAQRGGSTAKDARVRRPKTFFLHHDVVTACLQHAAQYQQRQQAAASTLPYTHVAVGLALSSPGSGSASRLRPPPLSAAGEFLDDGVEPSPVRVDWATRWEPLPESGDSDSLSGGGSPIDSAEYSNGDTSDGVSQNADPSPLFWEQVNQYDSSSTGSAEYSSGDTSDRVSQDVSPSPSFWEQIDQYDGSSIDSPAYNNRDSRYRVKQQPGLAPALWEQIHQYDNWSSSSGSQPLTTVDDVPDQLGSCTSALTAGWIDTDVSENVNADRGKKRRHEHIEDSSLLRTAQLGNASDTFQETHLPRRHKTTPASSPGLVVATGALMVVSLMLGVYRSSSNPTVDSDSSQVEPSKHWFWSPMELDAAIGVEQKGFDGRNQSVVCMQPADMVQMCTAAGDPTRSCVRQMNTKWPRWRQQDTLDIPDVGTACEQLSIEAPPAVGRRQLLETSVRYDCRVEWSAAVGIAGHPSAVGIRTTPGVLWSSREHIRLYLFASAYSCSSVDVMSVGACGTVAEADDIGIFGDSVGGLWSYDLLNGSGHGWTRKSNSQLRAMAATRGGNLRTLPPARNNAVQWSLPSGSLYIMGGMGCTSEPYGSYSMPKEPSEQCAVPQQLSDLWYLDVATALWSCLYMPEPTVVPSSIVVFDGSHEVGADGRLNTTFKHTWPVGRTGRSAWSVCDENEDSFGPGEVDCELWLFGGESVDTVGMFNQDGEIVQLQEIGPVDSLWRYVVSLRNGMQQTRGSWLLVSGWDDGAMCRLTSPSEMADAPLCRTFVDGRLEFYPNTVLKTAAVPVEPCDHVWPVHRLTGEFVRFEDSRCPTARHAAAAWADSRAASRGAYIFGGLSSLHPGTLTNIDLGPEIHEDPVTEALMQTLIATYQGPEGWARALMFDDLWHFNGDARQPRWRRIPRPASTTGTEWPLAGGGHGWTTTDSSQMWLWLWMDALEPWSIVSGRAALSAGGSADAALPSQLWAFSVDAQVWKRVDNIDAEPRGRPEPEWPVTRRGELLDSNGWLLGESSSLDCARQLAARIAPGANATGVREVAGLWRWETAPPH